MKGIIMWFKQFANAISAHSATPVVSQFDLNIKEPDSYSSKRAAAISSLGDKWLMHPSNKVNKLSNATNVLRHNKVSS